jgi:hypothetical protein
VRVRIVLPKFISQLANIIRPILLECRWIRYGSDIGFGI